MQGTRNPLQDFGIQKIYVENFKNNTYRAGIEQMFTTAMVRQIEGGRTFKIVNSRDSADAILNGTVNSAEAGITSTTQLSAGTAPGAKVLNVATQFSASVSCSVTLQEPGGKVIFTQSFSGNKNFTGAVWNNNDEGATVPLTNDSEQRIAYEFLSGQMMSSAYQRMIDLF